MKTIAEKIFAVRFKVAGHIDNDELMLKSPNIKEARKYCTEWASFTSGVKIHTLREV
jgi:hypothetical protein|tara:strand:- start:19 stop:189 length:171 start_codon:yes stop_codon:yes gene_type:complete